ncbi:MAG: hypothetical protein HRU43_02040, partial [Simkaniaceae bacterium]|nr:hypothetical protein [Simkaniaceae bacterium]
MKIKYLLLFVMIPFLAFTKEFVKTPKRETGKPATIKVLLEKESDGVLLEARGSYTIFTPENGKKVSSG